MLLGQWSAGVCNEPEHKSTLSVTEFELETSWKTGKGIGGYYQDDSLVVYWNGKWFAQNSVHIQALVLMCLTFECFQRTFSLLNSSLFREIIAKNDK